MNQSDSGQMVSSVSHYWLLYWQTLKGTMVTCVMIWLFINEMRWGSQRRGDVHRQMWTWYVGLKITVCPKTMLNASQLCCTEDPYSQSMRDSPHWHATEKPHIILTGFSDFLNKSMKTFRDPSGLMPRETWIQTPPLPPLVPRPSLSWLVSQLGLHQQQ